MRKYSEAEIDNFALGGTGICDIHNGWSPSFEPFDFPALINAITSGNFTSQDAHIEDEEVPDYFATVIEKLKTVDLSDYDIVILSYGANDYTGEMNEATIKSAIANAVNKLYALNENINIVFDLPHYRLWNTPDDYVDDAYTHRNSLNYTLEDVINFFKEKLDTYGIAYIDNLKECNWNEYNMDKYFYHADGAHFLASGCKECAKRIVAKLSCLGFNIEKED
jgi:lysophospholipase L1-like esterase